MTNVESVYEYGIIAGHIFCYATAKNSWWRWCQMMLLRIGSSFWSGASEFRVDVCYQLVSKQGMLVSCHSKFSQVFRDVGSRSAHEYDRTDRASAHCASSVLIRRHDRVPLAAHIRLSESTAQSRRTGRCRRQTWINSVLWFMTDFRRPDPLRGGLPSQLVPDADISPPWHSHWDETITPR